MKLLVLNFKEKIKISIKKNRILDSFSNLQNSSRIQMRCASMWQDWFKICTKCIQSWIKSIAIVNKDITLSKTKTLKEYSLMSQEKKILQSSLIGSLLIQTNGNWKWKIFISGNMKINWDGIKMKCSSTIQLKMKTAKCIYLESNTFCIQNTKKERNVCASGASIRCSMAKNRSTMLRRLSLSVLMAKRSSLLLHALKT